MKKRCCLHCKEYSLMDEMMRCNVGWFCSIEHMQEYGSKKSAKIKAKAHTQKKKEFKLNDLPYQHKLTQKSFNRMRVLEELQWFRDKGIEPYCISCGKENMDWCCGHLKTVGAHGSLRYERLNTHLQCNRYCNMALSGNIEGNKNTLGYKGGIIHRFGAGYAKKMTKHFADNQHAKKWTGEELTEARVLCNIKIRQMEKELC